MVSTCPRGQSGHFSLPGGCVAPPPHSQGLQDNCLALTCQGGFCLVRSRPKEVCFWQKGLQENLIDLSHTSHTAIKERLAGVRHTRHLRWCFHVSQQRKQGHGLVVNRGKWCNWPGRVGQFQYRKHPKENRTMTPYTFCFPLNTSTPYFQTFSSFAYFKQLQKLEK